MNEFASPQTEWSKPRATTERVLFQIDTPIDTGQWVSEPYYTQESE